MMNRLKYIIGLFVLVFSLNACKERGTEKETNSVNKTDTRRNTTGTENTLVRDSASPRRDSAQHGGPDEPAH